MSALIPANFGAISTKFKTTDANDDLSSGIQSSFGLIGYKGKVWSIRYRGDETQLMREDGDGPRGSIEVVILSAAKVVSKVWYEQGYVEGSTAAPDCFSNNGVTPDAASAKKQCSTCALCPHNQWGSRITPAGKNGKACADSKRLAVVPLQDIANETYGGPMLLRVPAASLQDLAMYGQKMSQLGYPYYAVGTRISFDAQESYPKFTFNAIRPLKDDEADATIMERDGHQVHRILSENEFAPSATPAEAANAPTSVFEEPPEDQPKEQSSTRDAIDKEAAKREAEKAATVAANEAERKAVMDKAKAKKAAETKAKKEAAAKALAEEEAAAAVTTEGNDEDEEERELREMEEKLAAARAKREAAKADTKPANTKTLAAEAPIEQTPKATVVDDDTNAASDFENDLDSMLNDLLPS